MNRRHRAILRRGRLGILSISMLGLLLGCDGFDPSTLLPQKVEALLAEAGGDAGLADRFEATSAEIDGSEKMRSPEPSMDSIGPEESQRIYYQFVDDRGRVQFVERLSDVPEAWRDRVGFVEMSQPPPLTPLEARRSWQLSEGRTAEILLATAQAAPHSRGRQQADVLLYSASWCGYCTKARAHLDREGVEYEIRDIDNGAAAEELRAKTGRGGIPVLDFSGEILRGYSADQYDRAIDSIRG